MCNFADVHTIELNLLILQFVKIVGFSMVQ